MSECCDNVGCELELLKDRQSRILKIVLLINLVMFFVEIVSGFLANSISLIADSLDMLGDAIVYSISLYVISKDEKMKAYSALVKGLIMSGFGLMVFSQAIYKILQPSLPVYETMGVIGFLALIMNGICFALLWQHQNDDINMKSVWICSRNDIIANLSVLVAGFGVWKTQSHLPDIVIGLGLSILILKSSFIIMKNSIIQIRATSLD